MSDSTPPEASDAPVPPVAGATLRRADLLDEMDAGHFRAVVDVTRGLLDRRFDRMLRLVDVASTDVNLNPFLMLAMAPAYNIFSPFEAARVGRRSSR